LKKILSAIGVIVVFIVVLIAKGTGKVVSHTIGKVAGVAIGNALSKPSEEEIKQELINSFAKEAEELNKKTPIMIDKDTRLDKIALEPDARVIYFHTLPNYSSHTITSDYIQQNTKQSVKAKVCLDEKIKSALQDGATFVYVYNGNDGVEITRFEITKNDCNNLAVATTKPLPVSTEPVIQNNSYIEPNQSAPVSPEPAPSAQQEVVTTNTDNCTGDCVNGKGTIAYANGNRYEGKFKNGYPNGYGIVIYQNGNKYTGNFRKGVPVGKGTMDYANGDKYMGRFKNGLPEGRGTAILANGQRIVGKFKNGQPVYNNTPSHSQIREQVEVVREQAEEPLATEQVDINAQEQTEAEKELDRKEAEIRAQEQALNKAKERSTSTWDNDRYMQNREQQERREAFERLDRM
jgi:hypothetical protein